MSEQLSQAEIDALRDAVRTGKLEDETQTEQAAAHIAEIKVESYNFRKPKMVFPARLPILQLLHQAFAKSLQGMLFSMFKVSGEATLASMDQVSYGEFMLSMENPTYLLGLTLAGDTGTLGMELTPPMGPILLDMLVGGDGIAAATDPPREFSPLEMDILRAFSDRMIDELTLCWRSVHDLSFVVTSQAVEPEQFQISQAPDSPCLCMVVNLKINEAEGWLNMCYPFSTLQTIFQWADSSRDAMEGRRAETRQTALRVLQPVPLAADVELGRARITTRQLSGLQVGDVLRLRHRVGDPLVINVGGYEVGRGFVGIRRGRLAASVHKMINARKVVDAPAARSPAAPAAPARPPVAPAAKPRPETQKGKS